MPTETQPTVLFVTGSWHTPAHFGPIRDICEKAGYPTACQLFPSVGALPPTGVQEDANCIKDELIRLIEAEGKDVVVICHSYGGVVATQACEKRFNHSARQTNGQKGGIVRLVYMCAFLIPVGTSLEMALGGTLPPWIQEDADGMGFPEDPAYRFYHDLPEAEQERWIKECRKCPVTQQKGVLSNAGYLEHPVTYLYCENDNALPIEAQKMMVEGLKAMGGELEEESCSASHSPFLSMPERVFETIERAAKSS